MKWTMRIQQLGRLQLPSKYLSAYNYKPGQKIEILEEGEDCLRINFVRGKKK